MDMLIIEFHNRFFSLIMCFDIGNVKSNFIYCIFYGGFLKDLWIMVLRVSS